MKEYKTYVLRHTETRTQTVCIRAESLKKTAEIYYSGDTFQHHDDWEVIHTHPTDIEVVVLPSSQEIDYDQECEECEMWDDARIKAAFDNNPNLRVSTLARISGLTVRQVKKILLED